MTDEIKNKMPIRVIFLFYFLLFLISFAITSYFAWLSHLKFKETLVKQWDQQLEATLEISAINLENYFTKFSQNLEFLTHDTTVQRWAFTGDMSNCNRVDCPIRNLFRLHQGEADALVLIDSTGKIVERYWGNDEDKEMGEHCCSKTLEGSDSVDRKACISDVFINKSGHPAITISYPLFYKKHFAGALRWMVTIKNISRQFITPVKVGKEGYMFITDRVAMIVSHPVNTLIGKPVRQIIDSISVKNSGRHDPGHFEESKTFFDNIRTAKPEGSGKYIDFAYEKYCLAAYKKISIGDNQWTLIVSMPYSEISSPVRTNAITTFGLAGTVMLIIFIIGIALFIVQKKKTKLEVETKYLAEIAKTAKELRIERSMRLTAMIDGEENERQRISREIHDGLGQSLLAMKVKLENEIDKRTDENTDSLKDLKSLFGTTIKEVKRISDNLIPVILDEFGISTALKNLCSEVSVNNKFKIEYVSHGIPTNIDSKIQTYIYRLAQEGLNNIIKHSKAKEANLQLLGNENQINLIIHDEGCGFIVAEQAHGNGLNNMRERVAILSGQIEIESKPGEGTIIKIKIPIA